MTDICNIPTGSRPKRSLKVRAAVKAGGLTPQHSRRVLKVRSGLKAGGLDFGNHNRKLLVVRRALATVLRMFADPVGAR